MSEKLKSIPVSISEQESRNRPKVTRQALREKGLYKRQAEYHVNEAGQEFIITRITELQKKLQDRAEMKLPETNTFTKTYKGNFSQYIRDVINAYSAEYRRSVNPDEKASAILETCMAFERMLLHDVDTRDERTQLHNRTATVEFLAEKIIETEGMDKQLVIPVVDIDHFKSYNDSFGHTFGNAALMVFADTLHEQVSQYRREGKGIASRLGGEELLEIIELPKDTNSNNKLKVEKRVTKLSKKIAQAGKEFLDEFNETMDVDVSVAMFETLAHARPQVVNEIIDANTELINQVTNFLKLDGQNAEIAKPVELYSKLQQIISSSETDQDTKHLAEEYAYLFHSQIQVGTATIGYVAVDMSAPDSSMTFSDAEFIYRQVNGKDRYIDEQEFKALFDDYLDEKNVLTTELTYIRFKEKVQKKITEYTNLLMNPEDELAKKELEQHKLKWEILLSSVYKRRAGRLIDAANKAEEQQKNRQRGKVGSFSEKILTMKDMDAGAVQAEADYQFSIEQEQKNKKLYHELDEKLLALQTNKNNFDFDPRLRFFERWLRQIELNKKQFLKELEIHKKSVQAETTHEESTKNINELQQKITLHSIPETLNLNIQTARALLRQGQEDRFYDHLMHIYNERYLYVVENKEAKKALVEKKSYTFVSLDMDNLKAINDTCGHAVGDMALMQVALTAEEYFASLHSQNDTSEHYTKSARIIRAGGGEEFAFVFDGFETLEAQEHVKKIQEKSTKAIQDMLKEIVFEDELNGLQKVEAFIAQKPDMTEDKIKKEINSIGGFTAGIVNIHDLDINTFVDKDKGGKFNIGIIREIADKLAEKSKEVNGRGSSMLLQDLVDM